MAIYEIKSDRIEPIAPTTFGLAGVRERHDLQRLLRQRIDIVAPDSLIIAEEFGEWDESKRRIDLLGVDKEANLVVIELKRTEDGGHMELQAVRYAAMVSAMTFERAVDVFSAYLAANGEEGDARDTLLEFLEWDEPDEEQFGQDVRIVLASAEFSKELTTAVLWLNDHGLDIRCIRMRPYADGARVLLDVQQVIPLPEAEQYQVQVREKSRQQRAARQSGRRDLTKYDVVVNGVRHEQVPKRKAAFLVIQHLIQSGATPERIIEAAPWRKHQIFRSVSGTFESSEEFVERLAPIESEAGRAFDRRRFYTDREDLFVVDGRTYCFTNQWGGRVIDWVEALLKKFPMASVKIMESPQGNSSD